MRNIGTLSLLEAYDFEVTEPLVREDRRFLRMVRADLSGDPAERGAVNIANVAVPESVAADVAWGLCRLRILAWHRASRQGRRLRRSPQSNLRYPDCLCPRGAPHLASASLSLSPPVGSWHKRWNPLRGIVYFRGTRSPFHRSFSSPGECGSPVMVSLSG